MYSNFILNLEKNLRDELNQCQLKEFKKGEVVLREDSFVKYLPLVVEGSLRVFKQTEERQILYYYLNKGDICGLTLGACMENKPFNSDIVAYEQSLVIQIPVSKVLEWQKIYVSWNLFLIKAFTVRQQQMLKSFGEIDFSKMEQRIKDYLCYLLKEGHTTAISITHQELANELGTTRVVISQILKSLESSGLLELVSGTIKRKKLDCSSN